MVTSRNRPAHPCIFNGFNEMEIIGKCREALWTALRGGAEESAQVYLRLSSTSRTSPMNTQCASHSPSLFSG